MSMISFNLPLVSGPAFFASLRYLISAEMNPDMLTHTSKFPHNRQAITTMQHCTPW